MEEFKKSFTTIVLAFEPTADFAPGGRPASTLEFARTRLRGTAPAFAFVILTGVILQLVGVLNPLFSRVFMDNVLGQGRLDWLRPLLMVMGAVLAIQIVNQWISTVYMLKIRGKLAIVANTTFMWHVLRLPVGFFTQRYAGDISQRQNSNEKIAETLINQLAPTALNFVLIVFYLAMMLWYSPLLTAIGVGTVLLNILLSRYLSGRRVDIVRRQKRDMSNLASTTVSGIEMIETIKSAGAEDGYFETWAGYQAGASNASVDFAEHYFADRQRGHSVAWRVAHHPGEHHRGHAHGLSGVYGRVYEACEPDDRGHAERAGNALRHGADRGRLKI